VQIVNLEADNHNQPRRLSFVGRTRPELKFDSIDELIAQLHKDEAEITAILSKHRFSRSSPMELFLVYLLQKQYLHQRSSRKTGGFSLSNQKKLFYLQIGKRSILNEQQEMVDKNKG